MKKGVMNLKDSNRGIWEGLKGRKEGRNEIITV